MSVTIEKAEAFVGDFMRLADRLTKHPTPFLNNTFFRLRDEWSVDVAYLLPQDGTIRFDILREDLIVWVGAEKISVSVSTPQFGMFFEQLPNTSPTLYQDCVDFYQRLVNEHTNE